MSEATTRTERYEQELDAVLAKLGTEDAKRDLLKAELIMWERREREFERKGARKTKPHPQFGPVSAFDYSETIAAIGQRLAKLGTRGEA